MQFTLPFYSFLVFKANLNRICEMIEDEVASIHEAHIYLKKFYSKKRRCNFSREVIDALFLQKSQYYHSPTIMELAYSPKIACQISVNLHTARSLYEYSFGKRDPSLEILGVRFSTDDKSEDAIRELAYYRGTELIRMVRVMKDPKWDICLLGEQQPFEEGKCYEKIKGKRIKDYFTLEDLIRFATNWGAPIGQDDFWASDQKMYCWGYLENDTLKSDADLADWEEWPQDLPFD